MVNSCYKNLGDYGFPTTKKVYVIAEIGINHGGDLSKAKDLINSAATTGVQAVKFQIYKAEDRSPKNNNEIYTLLKNAELSYDDFAELKELADKCNLDFIATAFDRNAVDFLNEIKTPLIKVSSFDLENSFLLDYLVNSNSNIICSIGTSELDAIKKAYKKFSLGKKMSILHCVSLYPLQPDDANLAAIYTLKQSFDCPIGYSDHTNGINTPLYAVAAGAQIIEKHYRIDDSMECIDAAVSISEIQMRQMMVEIAEIDKMMGFGEVSTNEKIAPNLIFKRIN